MSLSKFFYSKASLIIAIAMTILTFGYLYFFMVPCADCFDTGQANQIKLGLSFGFTHSDVETFFANRSEAQINCYLELTTIWDNIFPVFYGLMYVLWISLIFNPISSKTKWLNLFPFLQTIFDWLENSQLASMANHYLTEQTVDASTAKLAANFSMLKWSVSAMIFVIVLVGIGYRLLNWNSNKK